MTDVLVLIDVDGVLRPLEATATTTGFDVHVPAADLPPTTFVRTDPDGDVRLRLELDPALHGPWLRDLRARADVRLASTWEDAFNTHLAPLLGIDPLPLGVSHALQPPKMGHRDPFSWKTYAIARLYDDVRPLVLVDDSASHLIPWEPTEVDRRDARDGGYELALDPPWREGPTLVIAPDPRVGLTAAEMSRVDAFVARYVR